MGILGTLVDAAVDANEEAHGSRLLSGLDDTKAKLATMHADVRAESIERFVRRRWELISQVRNWSSGGRIQAGRALQDQSRRKFDFDQSESYALWMTGAWLESGARRSEKAQGVHRSLEELAKDVEGRLEVARARPTIDSVGDGKSFVTTAPLSAPVDSIEVTGKRPSHEELLDTAYSAIRWKVVMALCAALNRKVDELRDWNTVVAAVAYQIEPWQRERLEALIFGMLQSWEDRVLSEGIQVQDPKRFWVDSIRRILGAVEFVWFDKMAAGERTDLSVTAMTAQVAERISESERDLGVIMALAYFLQNKEIYDPSS